MTAQCRERHLLYQSSDRSQRRSIQHHGTTGSASTSTSTLQQPQPQQFSTTKFRLGFNIKTTKLLVFVPLLCTITYLSVFNIHLTMESVRLWRTIGTTGTSTSTTSTDMDMLEEVIVPVTPPTTSSTAATTATVSITLRYNYTNLQRYSQLAHDIASIQSNQNCSLTTMTTTTGYFWYRNRYGLGSDLHVYSIAVCNVLQMNKYNPTSATGSATTNTGSRKSSVHVRTLLPWTWYDEQNCRHRKDDHSAMTCYFPESEPSCPTTTTVPQQPQQQQMLPSSVNLTRKLGKIKEACPDIIRQYGTTSVIRTATTEFLFTRVSNLIQDEGERQLQRVFQNRTTVPPNLITVHIRWGDKVDEMKLVPITKYINAVHEILERRRSLPVVRTMYNNGYDDGVHIYLATEDPEALYQFQEAAPTNWNIYIDQYYIELLPHRKESSVYNGIPQMAKELFGRPGLIALGSLLVAMEANDYILTTSSNWSRLINEIRIGIIHPRCNHCTTMIDLNPGEY